MNVVADGQTVARGWAALGGIEDALEIVLGHLNVLELIVVILFGKSVCRSLLDQEQNAQKVQRTVSKSK